MLHRWLLTLILTLAVATPVLGKDDPELGDKAPALEIEEWVAGQPVTITPGPTYLLFFFSTTDRNAPAYMRLLNEMNETYAAEGVIIVAVSAEEKTLTRRFLDRVGDVTFSVGADRRGRTNSDWVKAFKVKDDPAGFIVGGEARVMHFGELSDDDFFEILKRVFNGRYDPRLEKEAKPRLEEAKRNRRVRNWGMATRMYDQVLELNRTVFADVTLDKFEMMLVEMGERDAAYAYAHQLVEQYASDPLLLMNLAEKITADPRIKAELRDLDVAQKAASAALNVVRPEDRPDALATLAMVLYHRGELDKAVHAQSQAWMLAAPKAKPLYKRDLDIYQAARERSASIPQSPAKTNGN